MTKSEYDIIIDRIQFALNGYEKYELGSRNIKLLLANGDKVTLFTPRKCISHLLGVDDDYLKGSNKFGRLKNSYDILRDFVDNKSYEVYLSCCKGEMDFNKIFSQNINEKLDAFWYNLQFHEDDIVGLVKYDAERMYQSIEFGEKANYYIINKRNDDYFVLGIVANEDRPGYVPVTSRKYSYNDEKFKFFLDRCLTKQEISFPVHARIVNSAIDVDKSYSFPYKVKQEYMRRINAFTRGFDTTISVELEYSKILENMLNNKNVNYNEKDVLRLFKDSILDGAVVDVSSLDDNISGDLLLAINAYNDLLCSNNLMGLNTDSKTYTETYNENKRLIEENERLHKENEKLSKEVSSLKEDNLIYSDAISVLNSSLKKIRRP